MFSEIYIHVYYNTMPLRDICVAAVECGTLPTIPLSTLPAFFTNTYQSTVTYACARGHWLSRDVYQFTVTCSARALWEPAPAVDTACIRMYKSFNFVKTFDTNN